MNTIEAPEDIENGDVPKEDANERENMNENEDGNDNVEDALAFLSAFDKLPLTLNAHHQTVSNKWKCIRNPRIFIHYIN